MLGMASSTRRPKRYVCFRSRLGTACLTAFGNVANQSLERVPIHACPPFLESRVLLDSRCVALALLTATGLTYSLREAERAMDNTHLVHTRHHGVNGSWARAWPTLRTEEIPAVRSIQPIIQFIHCPIHSLITDFPPVGASSWPQQCS